MICSFFYPNFLSGQYIVLGHHYKQVHRCNTLILIPLIVGAKLLHANFDIKFLLFWTIFLTTAADFLASMHSFSIGGDWYINGSRKFRQTAADLLAVTDLLRELNALFSVCTYPLTELFSFEKWALCEPTLFIMNVVGGYLLKSAYRCRLAYSFRHLH
jgi:hypothetical protein